MILGVNLEKYLEAQAKIKEIQSMNLTQEELKTRAFELGLDLSTLDTSGDPELDIDSEGNANIYVTGGLKSELSMWDRLMGATSYNDIIAMIDEANENSMVKKIVFHMESYGGEVSIAFKEAMDSIYLSKKPTTSIIYDTCASACYFLASQSNEILAYNDFSSVGSVGVVVDTVSYDKYFKEMGVEFISVTSTNAPLKRVDLTSEAGQATLRAELDDIHALLVSYISRARGQDADYINENYGRGAMLTASKAIENKMIDGLIETEDREIQTIKEEVEFPVATSAKIEDDLGVETHKEGDNIMETEKERGRILELLAWSKDFPQSNEVATIVEGAIEEGKTLEEIQPELRKAIVGIVGKTTTIAESEQEELGLNLGTQAIEKTSKVEEEESEDDSFLFDFKKVAKKFN